MASRIRAAHSVRLVAMGWNQILSKLKSHYFAYYQHESATVHSKQILRHHARRIAADSFVACCLASDLVTVVLPADSFINETWQ